MHYIEWLILRDIRRRMFCNAFFVCVSVSCGRTGHNVPLASTHDRIAASPSSEADEIILVVEEQPFSVDLLPVASDLEQVSEENERKEVLSTESLKAIAAKLLQTGIGIREAEGRLLSASVRRLRLTRSSGFSTVTYGGGRMIDPVLMVTYRYDTAKYWVVVSWRVEYEGANLSKPEK